MPISLVVLIAKGPVSHSTRKALSTQCFTVHMPILLSTFMSLIIAPIGQSEWSHMPILRPLQSMLHLADFYGNAGKVVGGFNANGKVGTQCLWYEKK